ncbi:cobalt-zinc-cadmium resistance protein CzcC [Pseudoalteromonas ulvae UL12]|nr:TolC family protein [Pseudoalteromonas ulvae]MBE0365323.1 cobalt-zinc-cadmium resistance protein CzcC [Pseudoalteromonas ulvae UL12]
MISLLTFNVNAFEKELNLQEAIRWTLKQNPELKIFDFKQQALIGQEQTASLNPAFELEVEAENFVGSGDFNKFDSAELTIALSSVIEMGDKRSARIGLISNSKKLLNAKTEVEALNLIAQVTQQFIEVLASQERVLLADNALSLAQEAFNVVDERNRAGATPNAEVKRARAAIAQAKLTSQSEKKRLEYLRLSLAAFWGESTLNFSKVTGDLFQFGNDSDFETLFAKLETNPAIQIYANEERLKEAELRLARTESTANIQWSVGVRRSQESNDTALVAGFSLPLFADKRNSGAIASALAERDQVAIEKDVTKLKLRNHLLRAYSNRQQAILTTNALRQSVIPMLDQALDDTQIAYQKGRNGYLDYVSARQELLNARRTLIDAASAALFYGAEIEKLTNEALSL